VNCREFIRGISRNIPENHNIWVFIIPLESGRYFPQNHPADIQSNGEWTSNACIGEEEDHNKSFDIIVTTVDTTAQNRLNYYFIQATTDSIRDGLETLPKGVTIFSRVSVIRR
jgi:hypothetical protein